MHPRELLEGRGIGKVGISLYWICLKAGCLTKVPRAILCVMWGWRQLLLGRHLSDVQGTKTSLFWEPWWWFQTIYYIYVYIIILIYIYTYQYIYFVLEFVFSCGLRVPSWDAVEQERYWVACETCATPMKRAPPRDTAKNSWFLKPHRFKTL